MITLPISTRGQPTRYSIAILTLVPGVPSVGNISTMRGAHPARKKPVNNGRSENESFQVTGRKIILMAYCAKEGETSKTERTENRERRWLFLRYYAALLI